VTWRTRNVLDRGRTLLRYVAELVVGSVGDASLSRGYGAVRENVASDMIESEFGLSTPELFWKCPDCRRRGYSINGREVTT
jgi:hypothetical protein